MAIKFRLGKDPLGSLSVDEVLNRIQGLSHSYAENALSAEVLYPARVRVWAVTHDNGGHWHYAPVKVLGYAKDVKTYLQLVDADKPMTGIDAVLALKKRGFIECDPAEFPELEKHFIYWMEHAVCYSPRSKFRFMIHRRDIALMSKTLKKILAASAKLEPSEHRALIDLLTAGEA